MENNINKEFSAFAITTRHFGLLLVVNENDDITQKEVGELLRIDRTTMVKLVDYLESHDYIKREPKANDRRAYVLTLTKKSNALIKTAMQIMMDCERLFSCGAPSYAKGRRNGGNEDPSGKRLEPE